MSKIYYIRYHSKGEIKTNFILAISPRYAVQTLIEDYNIPKSNVIAVYEHMDEKLGCKKGDICMCNADKVKFAKLGDSVYTVQWGMEDQDFNWYSNQFIHHKPVGFLIDPLSTTVIFKMKPGHKGWTPYHCARDCGDHYIVARFDRYDRIDKKTGKLTKDVEDK